MTDQTPERSRRLGRGLGALIGTPGATAAPAEEPYREIRIDLIRPNPLQPRRDFADAELRELEESLRTSGLLQPITVRHRPDGHFELVAGERRLRAARRIGWSAIPAFVREVSNEQMLSLALVENLQRSDLNPIEEAEGYRRLIGEFGLVHQQVALAVGKDRSTITNALRLLSLPDDVQQLVRDGALTVGHARALLSLPSERDLGVLARRIVAEGMTVRAVERLGQEEKPAASRRPRPASGAATAEPPEVRRIADRLRRHLQTDVTIHADHRARGELRIRFYSADDLERLLDLIAGPSADID